MSENSIELKYFFYSLACKLRRFISINQRKLWKDKLRLRNLVNIRRHTDCIKQLESMVVYWTGQKYSDITGWNQLRLAG